MLYRLWNSIVFSSDYSPRAIFIQILLCNSRSSRAEEQNRRNFHKWTPPTHHSPTTTSGQVLRQRRPALGADRTGAHMIIAVLQTRKRVGGGGRCVEPCCGQHCSPTRGRIIGNFFWPVYKRWSIKCPQVKRCRCFTSPDNFCCLVVTYYGEKCLQWFMFLLQFLNVKI